MDLSPLVKLFLFVKMEQYLLVLNALMELVSLHVLVQMGESFLVLYLIALMEHFLLVDYALTVQSHLVSVLMESGLLAYAQMELIYHARNVLMGRIHLVNVKIKGNTHVRNLNVQMEHFLHVVNVQMVKILLVYVLTARSHLVKKSVQTEVTPLVRK